GLAGEGGNVVGDKPIHRRDRPRRRRVPRRRRGFTDLEPVVVVQNAVQLGVGMEVLLTRVRVSANPCPWRRCTGPPCGRRRAPPTREWGWSGPCRSPRRSSCRPPGRTGARAHCPGTGSQTTPPRCDQERGTYPVWALAISPYLHRP